MDEKIKAFLIVNVVVLTLLILFMRYRRPTSRTKLKLTNKKKKLSSVMSTHEQEGTESVFEPSQSDENKSLNVIFTWNAHDWDAYEVLGVPAGSAMDEIVKAYDEALSKVDDESKEFIHRAYKAICDHQKS